MQARQDDMTSRQLLIRDLLVLFGITGWALSLPYYGSELVVSMALTCLMYVALSSSWGLFCGSSRYLSLAATRRQMNVPGCLRHHLLEQLAALGLGAAAQVPVALGQQVECDERARCFRG